MADYVGAVDQGTTSTRFMIFDHGGNEVARHQLEHEQILPQAGWVEHNPTEIWERTRAVIETAMNKAHLHAADLAALGITNQRETAVVWNRHTGRPYYNAIVWQDTRTDRIAAALDADERGQVIRRKAGLPPATYFAGGKIQWLLENVEGLRADAEAGDAIFGTMDTWLLWNLTGGVDGGVHVTDVTNASRTMLMDLETLDWDDELLGLLQRPARHAPGDPALLGPGRLRQDPRRRPAARRGPAHRRPRRPAGRHRRPGLLHPGHGEEHLRHRQLPAAEHRQGDRPLRERAADHGRLQVRRRGRGLRPRRLHRGDRLGRAVAARPARHHLRRGAERVAGPAGRGQRRGVLRAGLLRPVRAVLALGRPRRHRRPVPLQHQRPPGARHPGVDRLPDPRRRRGDGAGLRRAAGRAARGRRRDRQRAGHGDPGRRARRAGVQAGRGRDHGAGRGLRRGPGRRLLDARPTSWSATGTRTSAGSRGPTRPRAPRATATGRRPSTGR